MEENDISPFFIIKKIREGDELKMEQKYIKIRMNSNKVMAIHYKAPMERTIELEMFFEKFNPIDRINYNIGGTGWVGANFRGLIDGKDESLPIDYDYKILERTNPFQSIMIIRFLCLKSINALLE